MWNCVVSGTADHHLDDPVAATCQIQVVRNQQEARSRTAVEVGASIEKHRPRILNRGCWSEHAKVRFQAAADIAGQLNWRGASGCYMVIDRRQETLFVLLAQTPSESPRIQRPLSVRL
jgi:hypothetical protein